MREIWLAAQSGGFHFTLQGKEQKSWCNTVTGELLSVMLSSACLAQSSETVHFDFT
jgi:frataxin-like iron-binding protein CyaY